MPKKDTSPLQPPPISTYTCVSPIEHNGRRVQIGDTVEVPAEMAEDVAAELVQCGALQV